MNRRTVCRALGAGSLLALSTPLGTATILDRRIGLQLYTVRHRLQRDFEGTLQAVAAIGFEDVEFAGYFGRRPRQVAGTMRALGVDPVSAHFDIGTLRSDLGDVLEASREIGHRFVVVPSLPAAQRRSLDAYTRLADELNRIGGACRGAGLRLAYHNHAFEFEPIGGRLPYDVLLEHTEPALVAMELDLYWLTLGGQDPLAYFDRWPGRFPLWHVKDMGSDREMVDLGSGTIDFSAIFARARDAGLEHCFVEHDRPVDPLATARKGYAYLRDLEPGVDR